MTIPHIYIVKSLSLISIKILISTAWTWERNCHLQREKLELMPINFSSSIIAFTPITGDGYQPTCVVLSLTHTLEASLVLLPPTANRLRIWIFKRWPSQLPSSRTFWWEFSWTSAWMARSSPRYALKIWNILDLATQMLIGLLITGIRQLLLLLQAIRPFPE